MSSKSTQSSDQADRETPARPFLKWAGGKRQLLSQLMSRIPTSFNHYIEPFIGGGALFFHLEPASAQLGDANAELVNCYSIIKNQVRKLITELSNYPNDSDFFYELRATDPTTLTKVQRAARTVFLNRTCYNGLYRVNRKGIFNTPFGRYQNPTICDEENLKRVSRVLKGVNIRFSDFELSTADAKPGDFVYFDPPYAPISPTASFTAYTGQDFGLADQERLAECCRRLDRRGVKFLLSNSWTPVTRKLYKGFELHKIHARRNINSKKDKRGPVPELLVTNYPT